MLEIITHINAPLDTAEGIKEALAMDQERFGDVRVVSVREIRKIADKSIVPKKKQRLIDVHVAIQEVNDMSTSVLNEWDSMGVRCLLERQPTVEEVKDKRKGKWIKTEDYIMIGEDGRLDIYRCSNCDAE
ncbi:hypothetical protein MHBO_004768, partial [Bonamia ostreae]